MNIFTPFFVSALSMALTTFFSLVFGIYLYATYRLILNARVRENVPGINEVPLPDMIPYDHVQIVDRFIFDREGDALIYETYLDRLQMWICRNRFRPLTCLQGNRGNLLFQQQTVESLSKNILIELFSVDRETRLKELLRYICYHIDEQYTVIVARSIMFIFSSNLGIKIVGDGPNEFEEVPMAIFHALCTSQNLFVCDFMLLYLTSSANVGDIIATFNLNELLCIDTYNEDTHVGNLFNQLFMNYIQWKPGFPNLFGYNNRRSIAFRRAAADVLRDIQLFQTILTNIPNDFEINDNVNGDIPGNNNGGIYDENRREIERLQRIERMNETAAVRNEDEDIEEGILAWLKRTVLGGGAKTVIPRVAYTDVERERRWAFLGFHGRDREGFGRFFIDLPRITLAQVNELRTKMALINRAYRVLTAHAYLNFLDHQVSLRGVSPRSRAIIGEIKLAYREMTEQYNNYQRTFRNFEVAYTILKAIDIVERCRQNNRRSIERLNQGLQRLEGGLQQATYADVNRFLAIGAKLMTDLKLTWDMYVVFSTSFYDLKRAYQGSINATERNVLETVADFRAEYDSFKIIRRFLALLQ